MKVFLTLSASERKNLLLMFAAGLLFWSSIGSLLPTLPLYLRSLGIADQQLGFVMGAFAIGLLLARPYIGAIADRHSRKRVILIGTAVCGLAPLCYLLVNSVPSLMMVRSFHGISLASFTTGYIALVTDLTPPKNRGEVLGYMSLINPVGVSFGPALGGFVQQAFGNEYLFILTGSFGFLAFLIMTQVQEKRRTDNLDKTDSSTAIQPGLWRLLLSPRIRILSLVLLHVGLAFGAMTAFISLLIQATGVNFNAGLFFTAAAITSFGIRLVAGPLSDRIGRGIFITLSISLYGISMFMLTFADTAWLFLLSGCIEGAGFGLLIPTTSAIVADRAYPHERGRLFGLCLGGFDLGIALAGPIAGMIAQAFSYQTIFICITLILILGLLLFLTQSSKDLPHSLRYALGRGRDIYAL
ncbi:MAG: MFS transporter [Roseofilum sp. SBFL]|uniref:MFS transporter n=1 Tax=unclassified Roseofilum TaxID=2620099 RepID=UPI001B14A12B|nr:MULTISPECIES: MFS transporter [unclassified Roseofilum]MBP0013631.1 MFS transporter [Roseofilum sp. SID3]MBP0025025.1 MFS transporter [Roseofilum sp. SID2]MBP0037163.1 MFS transporter [Roseofilum sp. SID1]MBP0040966.1 MFS transporter [Roseofilum sp. SBFL]